jgi:hypothetical protein
VVEISLNCTIQNERSVVNEARKTLLISLFSHSAATRHTNAASSEDLIKIAPMKGAFWLVPELFREIFFLVQVDQRTKKSYQPNPQQYQRNVATHYLSPSFLLITNPTHAPAWP